MRSSELFLHVAEVHVDVLNEAAREGIVDSESPFTDLHGRASEHEHLASSAGHLPIVIGVGLGIRTLRRINDFPGHNRARPQQKNGFVCHAAAYRPTEVPHA